MSTTQLDKKIPSMIREWKVGRKIGFGSFGEIYAAQHADGTNVAIKFEKFNSRHPQLLFEAKVMKVLSRMEGFAQLYWYGVHNGFHVIVMDLLGPSLEQLFNNCGRKLNARIGCLLGLQMLERVRQLHKMDNLHRDIKPQNFLIGCSATLKETQVYMIDFGLSKRYRDKTGHHIPYKENKYLTGTIRYASVNTHRGHEQGRRDDMESLAYVILYFLRGGLPWQNAAISKNANKYDEIMQLKVNTPTSVLCSTLPSTVELFLLHTRALDFETTPNYNLLEEYLISAAWPKPDLRPFQKPLQFNTYQRYLQTFISQHSRVINERPKTEEPSQQRRSVTYLKQGCLRIQQKAHPRKEKDADRRNQHPSNSFQLFLLSKSHEYTKNYRFAAVPLHHRYSGQPYTRVYESAAQKASETIRPKLINTRNHLRNTGLKTARIEDNSLDCTKNAKPYSSSRIESDPLGQHKQNVDVCHQRMLHLLSVEVSQRISSQNGMRKKQLSKNTHRVKIDHNSSNHIGLVSSVEDYIKNRSVVYQNNAYSRIKVQRFGISTPRNKCSHNLYGTPGALQRTRITVSHRGTSENPTRSVGPVLKAGRCSQEGVFFVPRHTHSTVSSSDFNESQSQDKSESYKTDRAYNRNSTMDKTTLSSHIDEEPQIRRTAKALFRQFSCIPHIVKKIFHCEDNPSVEFERKNLYSKMTHQRQTHTTFVKYTQDLSSGDRRKRHSEFLFGLSQNGKKTDHVSLLQK